LHTRSHRGWLATFVLCTLLISIGSSTAGTKTKLGQTRRELRSLRAKIQQQELRADSIKKRISELNSAIADVQMTLNQIGADVRRVRGAVSESQARIDELQRRITATRAVAREQAVLLYKSGGTDTLDALLDAGSITEFNDRIEMLGVAAQKNTGALVRFGRLRVAIRNQFQTLFDRRAELSKARRAQTRVLDMHRDLKARLADELVRLSRRIGQERTREGHLERAAARLKRKIVAAQARSSVEALGRSVQGFIWPLNGPVTSGYGSRWGGMHTGMDIDGYTGQPVVAAKTGRVIYLGAGMTGYGNTVVLDHGGGVSTLYAHLSGYAVSNGADVDQGQVLGYVGCTGNCYGDHLHFEVRIGGNPVDPLGYLP
jgi:murein DD-endopeptidase MepM/ murein hydrolase activator NlpD